MADNFEIVGLKEVKEALKELAPKLQLRIINSFLQKAGREYIVKPLKSGLSYSSFTKKGLRVIQNRQDKLSIVAGFCTDRFWIRFVEYGTKERTKGHKRGRITARPQVGRIVDMQINPIIEFARKDFGEEIQKNLKRRIKKLRTIK